MKQSLQLRLSQQLAMTPQLQQAIRLLQLSTLELQQEIQQALESNPLLEQDDDQQDPVSDDTSHTENQSDSTTETTTENDVEEFDTLDALEQKEMPDDLPLDTQWEEIYTAGTPSGTSNDYMDDELPLYQGETTASLQDYLTWQADLTPFTETDRAIAISIIDAVDETGYLTVTTDDILLGMGDDEIELDEVEAVLKRIQRFDPIGVAARDLKECLLIQLSAFSTETPYLKETQLVISQYLELLGNRDFRQLMRQTKLREETLKS
ncbi:RNA polymerase factor sigma-54, partial [Escherichia coli]